MDAERVLVSRVLKTQSLDAVLSRDIESHHFIQRAKDDTNEVPMSGEVFSWIMQHHRRYGAAPSMELARATWPLFEVVEDSNPTDVLLDQFLRAVSRREMILATRQLSGKIDEFPTWEPEFNAADFFFEVASAVARSLPSTSITRYSDSLNRLALYKQREETGETPGISLAVPMLDTITYGAQPGDLVIIQGFLGNGKSSLAIMICAIEYFEKGRTGLFKSLEMDGDKLAARWDAYAAGFEYRALKRLELGEGDLQKWEEAGERAANSKFEKDILVDDRSLKPTAEQIYSDVMRWRPDFTVVDTLDEVRAPSNYKQHWEQQDYVARELKGVARTTRKPLFGIAQSGRDAEKEGSKLGNVAGSISIPRKADIVIAVDADQTMKKLNKCNFTVLKNRDDNGEGTVVPMHWDRSKMRLREWRPTDNIAVKV